MTVVEVLVRDSDLLVDLFLSPKKASKKRPVTGIASLLECRRLRGERSLESMIDGALEDGTRDEDSDERLDMMESGTLRTRFSTSSS